MYQPDIRYLPAIAILGSDRLLSSSLDQINGKYIPPDQEHRTLVQALHDYSLSAGTLLRDNDAEYMADEWLASDNELGAKVCLKKLSQEFLIWRGDCFEVQTIKLKDWQAVCSMIDPTWIIAFSYGQFISNGTLSVDIACSLIGKQCSMAFPKTRDTAIADNHVHMGGHGSANLSLLDFAYYLSSRKPVGTEKWPRRKEYHQFESGFRDKQHIPKVMNILALELGKDIWNDASTGDKKIDCSWGAMDTCVIDDSLVTMANFFSASSPAQHLMKASTDTNYPGANRWLLFLSSLLTGEQTSLSGKQLRAFIQVSNILRNYMIVAGVGLTQFVQYFGFKSRKATSSASKKSLSHSNNALDFDMESGTCREFRVSPNVVLDKSKTSFQLKPLGLLELVEAISDKSLASNTHFVIHFTRGFNGSNKHDKEQLKHRKELQVQVRKLQSFSGSVHWGDFAGKRQTVDSEAPTYDLRKLIRGYDVAGDENELPIEIFAPSLRVLRSSVHRSPGVFDTRFPQPFITVHAGEDFSHLLSGMRAIDEAVEFCNLGARDRIGHALALGVDINLWAQRQRRVYLTAGEHLDNLVWCYQQCLDIAQQVTELHCVLPLLESKIQRWSAIIHSQSYTPRVLYKAWHLRRNCPIHDPEMRALDDVEDQHWMPDRRWLVENPESPAKQLWQKYLEPPSEGSNAHKVVTIICTPDSYSASLTTETDWHDSISPAELKLWEAIQDLQMERYNQRRIVIEACPTSNLYIGRFHSYREHPVFRWSPPNPLWMQPGERFNKFGLRRGALTVCLNTDDSGLMPTTIANEHQVIETTAREDFHIGSRDAAVWIDQIRQDGVNIFQINHLAWHSGEGNQN